MRSAVVPRRVGQRVGPVRAGEPLAEPLEQRVDAGRARHRAQRRLRLLAPRPRAAVRPPAPVEAREDLRGQTPGPGRGVGGPEVEDAPARHGELGELAERGLAPQAGRRPARTPRRAPSPLEAAGGGGRRRRSPRGPRRAPRERARPDVPRSPARAVGADRGRPRGRAAPRRRAGGRRRRSRCGRRPSGTGSAERAVAGRGRVEAGRGEQGDHGGHQGPPGRERPRREGEREGNGARAARAAPRGTRAESRTSTPIERLSQATSARR